MSLVSSFTVFLCKRIEYANIRNMWIQKVKNTIFFSKSYYLWPLPEKLYCIILIVFVVVSYIFVNFAPVIITNRLSLG